MGMSTSIVGVRDLDKQFAKMAAVKEACEKAGIEYPPGLLAYFSSPGENIAYLRQEMEEVDISAAITKTSEDATNTWEVDLKKLPEDVKAVRFSNGY